MGKNLQLNSSLGFELFDKSDFGMTDFSQKINYQRALQGELERTITSLDEIRQARVHLVIPENSLFNQHTNQPKAAVTLHLKKPLNQKQVRSIQHLVSASVANLQLKHVVVVDQNGHTLTQSGENTSVTHLSTKKAIEHYLGDKVLQILRTIFSEDEVMVKIDASLNYDELQRERIKPQSEGLITHEKESKHLTPGKNEKDKANQDITLEKSYQFGSEKERFKRASGALEKLSISVVLPQSSNQNTLDKVQQLVKSTVGFDAKRGDSISVVALINPPAPSLLPTIPLQLKSEPIKPVDYSLIAFVCVFLALGAIALMKHIRNKRRRLLLIELTHWLTHHE
jgi:flagellar M-ring protein FliF